MRIGIDIDDTIAKTREQTDVYAKEYTEKVLNRPFTMRTESTHDPKWARFIYSWSIDEDKNFWSLYYDKIVENVTPKEDAVDVINELSKKHEIILISARWEKGNGTVKKLTEDWLAKYDIHFDKIYLGYLDKKDIAKENNVDVFIEDSIKTARDIKSLGIKVLLMNSHQNKDIEVSDIKRVFCWKEIYREIERIEANS